MVAVTNVQTTGTGATNYTSLTSSAYTVGRGDNKRLVVFLAIWNPTSAGYPTGPAVTHAGVALTLQRTSQSSNANGGVSGSSTLFMFDLVLGSGSPSGVIAATWTGAQRCLMVAMTLVDVQQASAPTLAASQSLGSDSIASTATDLVVDGVLNASQNTTTGYAVVVGSGQTQLSNVRVNAGIGSEGSLGSSTATAPGAAATAMAWTGNKSLGPRSQHIVAGYAWSGTNSLIGGDPYGLLMRGAT